MRIVKLYTDIKLNSVFYYRDLTLTVNHHPAGPANLYAHNQRGWQVDGLEHNSTGKAYAGICLHAWVLQGKDLFKRIF